MPRKATILPKSFAATSSTAWAPKTEHNARSKLVGQPPRCRWPNTQTRDSLPVRDSISCATTAPMPPSRASRFDGAFGGGNKVAALLARAFSDHDDREMLAAFFALLNLVADGVVTKWNFRNQNDVGSARHARK